MNDRDFTNRLETSLNRGMASVPLPAVEPANARYRIAASNAGRRPISRLTVVVAAVGMALLLGLAGSAASGAGPAYLLSATVHEVVVFVEQQTIPAEPAPAPPTSETSVPTASASSESGPEPATAPESPDRASELYEPSLELIAERQPAAVTPEPSPEPIVEPNPAPAPPDPSPAHPEDPPPAD